MSHIVLAAWFIAGIFVILAVSASIYEVRPGGAAGIAESGSGEDGRQAAACLQVPGNIIEMLCPNPCHG
jgi:hypothetical protein